MKLNKSFSSPIYCRHKGIKPPKKAACLYPTNSGAAKRKCARRRLPSTLPCKSRTTRARYDSNVRRLKEAMNNFDKYTHAMERKEARLKRRRRATLAKLDDEGFQIENCIKKFWRKSRRENCKSRC